MKYVYQSYSSSDIYGNKIQFVKTISFIFDRDYFEGFLTNNSISYFLII